MEEAVKLHGTSISPYNRRVVWALKLKSIPYQFIEEDIENKSAALLELNPVYKKIPVLVHRGKPICESMRIVEYLDEVWPQNPLMPSDPYDKAQARFWVNFADDKIGSLWKIYQASGKDREQAIKETAELLEAIEEHGPNMKNKFFGGDNIGIVDIAFGGVANWLGTIESKLEIQILDPVKLPRVDAWIKIFREAPIIKDNLATLESRSK